MLPYQNQKEPGIPGPPESTNNDASQLAESMESLDLRADIPANLPPSLITGNSAYLERKGSGSSPVPLAKVRRTASSNSLGFGSRSATPTLKTKNSLTSLMGTKGTTPPRSPAARRVSSNLALISQASMSPKSQLSGFGKEPAPPSPPTAASVARSFFERDTARPAINSPFTVVLHDSCYGHRFSRPKTSKASLATIVERPERMLSVVLGVAAAFVRLGGRHMGGKNPPHPQQLPESPPFVIQRSTRSVSLNSAVVTNVHGSKWMNELKMMCEGAEAKLALNGKELVRPGLANDGHLVDDRPKLHEGDLYLCSESLDALQGALGGVLDAVDSVFSGDGPNKAFVGIRPPGHHCSKDYPSGFCWLNNVHVGISHAASEYGMTHAAIIDFDLHHGDGSQSMTWAHNARAATLPKNAAASKKTKLGYFSLHDINSYPCEWGDDEKVKNASLCVENAHGQSIWNVHLQPWRTDAEFWDLYEKRYLVLLAKARAFLQTHRDRLADSSNGPEPRAAIFVSAGFDASEWEGQGMQRHKVNVPTDFYARFTKDINQLADEEGLAVGGRVISVLEGGYSDRALTSGVLSHLCGLAVSTSSCSMIQAQNGLGSEMGMRLGMMDQGGVSIKNNADLSFDSQWWSPPALEELDSIVSPALNAVPKKPRGPVNPTYITPTQSFAAKAINPSVRHSVSGQPSRPVDNSDHVPDVSWSVATHELSKLLTPDRQTRSCKPEDLNAEATKVRRNRQSTGGAQIEAPGEVGKKMQLRDRKPKVPLEPANSRPGSRVSRRQTIGNVAELESEENKIGETGLPAMPRQRRVSVASTTLSTTEEIGEPQARPADNDRRPSQILQSNSVSVNLPLGSTITKSRSPSISLPPKKQPVAARQNSTTKPTAAPSAPKNNDVDSLSAGVRKMNIKLNMPPKGERSISDDKKKAVKAPRKVLPAPKASTSSSQPPVKRTLSTVPHKVRLEGPSATMTPAPIDKDNAKQKEMRGPSSDHGIKGKKLLHQKSIDQSFSTLPADPTLPSALAAVTGDDIMSNSVYMNIGDRPNETNLAETTNKPTLPDYASGPFPAARTPVKINRQELPIFTSSSPIPFKSQSVEYKDGRTGNHGNQNIEDKDGTAAPMKQESELPEPWSVPLTPDQRMR